MVAQDYSLALVPDSSDFGWLVGNWEVNFWFARHPGAMGVDGRPELLMRRVWGYRPTGQ